MILRKICAWGVTVLIKKSPENFYAAEIVAIFGTVMRKKAADNLFCTDCLPSCTLLLKCNWIIHCKSLHGSLLFEDCCIGNTKLFTFTQMLSISLIYRRVKNMPQGSIITFLYGFEMPIINSSVCVNWKFCGLLWVINSSLPVFIRPLFPWYHRKWGFFKELKMIMSWNSFNTNPGSIQWSISELALAWVVKFVGKVSVCN